MSDNDAKSSDVVYRTVEIAPGMDSRYVGPHFDSTDEAKRAIEHFIETEKVASPTTWEDGDDCVVQMDSTGTSEYRIEEVEVHETFDELLDDPKREVPA